MDEREIILINNLQEYLEEAEFALRKKKFNTAMTLFFKAICSGVDLFIFRKAGFIPSSHVNRFRFVEEKYPEIYMILDRDFPFYQDSYTHRINKEAVEVLKEDAGRIKKMSEM